MSDESKQADVAKDASPAKGGAAKKAKRTGLWLLGLLGYINPMNLPRALFLQYRPTDKPYFGSRFMHLLGTTFMGSPKSKGLGDLRQDLQDTYYYLKVDRLIPNDDAAQKEWRIQSIKAQIYREIEHRELAKAVWMFLSAAAIAVTLGVSTLSPVFSKEEGEMQAVAGDRAQQSGVSSSEIEVDAATCELFGKNAMLNRLNAYQLNNYDALAEACQPFFQ